MIHVEEINDFARLANFRLAWNDLWTKTPGAAIFQAYDWLAAYWHHFGAGQRLRVLAVQCEQRLLGILPLVVRTETSRVGSVRVLTYPLHDWGTFFGPVGPDPAATLLAGLEHVRRTRRDWDVLDLRWVDRDGNDRGRTERAMRQAGFHPHAQAWDRAPVVEMSGSWQEYWADRDKKFRHNVERCQRRLVQEGEVTFVRYRPKGDRSMFSDQIRPGGADGDSPIFVERNLGQSPKNGPVPAGDPRWDLYDNCANLAGRSWQGDAEDGTTLSHPTVRSFLREVHGAAARLGAVDLNLLLLSGRPVAFIYNYHCQGRLYGLRKGFDPAFSTLRAGMVLQYRMLEDGFRRGDSCYDLGVGYHDSKRHWQTGLATSYRFTHFPAVVVRAQLLRLNRWVRRRVYGSRDVACAESA